MFCTSQVRIATAHAHNKFLLHLGRYKTVKNQLFTNDSYRAEIWWVGSRHQVDTTGTLYRGQTHRGCVVEGGVARALPSYHPSMLYLEKVWAD